MSWCPFDFAHGPEPAEGLCGYFFRFIRVGFLGDNLGLEEVLCQLNLAGRLAVISVNP